MHCFWRCWRIQEGMHSKQHQESMGFKIADIFYWNKSRLLQICNFADSAQSENCSTFTCVCVCPSTGMTSYLLTTFNNMYQTMWFIYSLKAYDRHYPLITWWSLGDHLVTNWWLLGDQLVTTWWPLGDYLVTNWWPLGDHLMTTWWPLGDHLATTWRPLGDQLTHKLQYERHRIRTVYSV